MTTGGARYKAIGLAYSTVIVDPAAQEVLETQMLVQQQSLARWDGRLSQYTLGGGVGPFVQIPLPGEGRR